MFGYLLSPLNTNAVGVVCRCLGHIAREKRDKNSPDFMIDFVQQGLYYNANIFAVLNIGQ